MDNDDILVYEDEIPVIESLEATNFKILIVDDDEEVHLFTKIALRNFQYQNKGIEFLSAMSAAEAKVILATQESISIVLLDIVMESNDAGLDVVKYIRHDLKDDLLRIIIRTGQPGEAPERYVIDNYDINDYKEKTELTVDKLYTTIRTALAQYTQLVNLLDKKNEIYKLLTTDILTALPNRIELNYDLDSDRTQSLMLIDIDRFSSINDAYGFEVGDEVLIYIKNIVLTLLKKEMVLYRLEGDVFAILMPNATKSILEEEVATIKEILETSPIEIEKISMYVSVSIGIVHSQFGNIIQKAEIALRQARRISHNRVEYYNNSLELIEDIEQNNIWTNKIAKALKRDDILTYYQPIVDCKTDKIVKYEALVRLREGDTIHPPFKFLSIARQSGYLHKITRKVFRQACAKFQDNELMFSVNITDHDLSESKFVDFLVKVAKEYAVEHSRIVFEILEETSMSNNLLAKENIQKISDLGFALSIDDFGTECSNFAQLGKHKYESIKIDGSFIKDLATCKDSQSITEAILYFTQKVGFKTVAEYVHSKEVYEIVKEMGIDYAQGYYFGEPKPDLLA